MDGPPRRVPTTKEPLHPLHLQALRTSRSPPLPYGLEPEPEPEPETSESDEPPRMVCHTCWPKCWPHCPRNPVLGDPAAFLRIRREAAIAFKVVLIQATWRGRRARKALPARRREAQLRELRQELGGMRVGDLRKRAAAAGADAAAVERALDADEPKAALSELIAERQPPPAQPSPRRATARTPPRDGSGRGSQPSSAAKTSALLDQADAWLESSAGLSERAPLTPAQERLLRLAGSHSGHSGNTRSPQWQPEPEPEPEPQRRSPGRAASSRSPAPPQPQPRAAAAPPPTPTATPSAEEVAALALQKVAQLEAELQRLRADQQDGTHPLPPPPEEERAEGEPGVSRGSGVMRSSEVQRLKQLRRLVAARRPPSARVGVAAATTRPSSGRREAVPEPLVLSPEAGAAETRTLSRLQARGWAVEDKAAATQARIRAAARSSAAPLAITPARRVGPDDSFEVGALRSELEGLRAIGGRQAGDQKRNQTLAQPTEQRTKPVCTSCNQPVARCRPCLTAACAAYSHRRHPRGRAALA
eukprot:COSAG04_NODE_209_length_20232_cov_116.817315_7_plen_532_part_00